MDTPQFLAALREKGVSFFTGVPDSVLKSLSSLLLQECAPHEHIIAANEGNCVGLAMGHYLATGKPAVVYMQNSGLGNTVNPVTSLADPDVYGIPMLFIIGWRGRPGFKDEPQHVKQGRITPAMLETLEMPYVIANEESEPKALVEDIWERMLTFGGPAAIVLPKGVLSSIKFKTDAAPVCSTPDTTPLLREAALNALLDLADPQDCFVATTGKTGRELFELRVQRGEVQRDFLTVGGMGHTASIALGVALAQPQRRVICLDGDGSLIMHMGAMAIAGTQAPQNLVHILLNNECHESVGGQPTVGGKLDFGGIAKACSYAAHYKVHSLEEIQGAWAQIMTHNGLVLLEISLWKGSRDDLGRPTATPTQNKAQFMEFLRS